VGRFRGACAICWLGLVAPRAADAAELELSCAELSPEQADELAARIRLLVHSSSVPRPESLQVECDQQQGKVVGRWAGRVRTQTFEGYARDIEPALRAVEQLLESAAGHDEAPEPEAPSSQGLSQDTTASPNASSTELARDEPAALTARAKTRTIGGIAFGGVLEPWPDPANTAIGPRLDLAWGAGSWAVTSVETLRLGRTPLHRLLSFDALIGVTWGAPFGPEPFGALVGVGGEWFSATASEQPTGERTASSAFVDLGVRLAQPAGPAALWFGAAGRYRFKELVLAEPVNAQLRRWSATLSLGVALRVP
jgi:hypothetical protein